MPSKYCFQIQFTNFREFREIATHFVTYMYDDRGMHSVCTVYTQQ